MTTSFRHFFIALACILAFGPLTLAQSLSQAIDPQGSIELLSGRALNPADPGVFFVADDGTLWYYDPNTPTLPSINRGLTWIVDKVPLSDIQTPESFVVHADPLTSPTGDAITADWHLEAAIFEVDTPGFYGYVVGIVRTFEGMSGTQTEDVVVFDPLATTLDLGFATDLLMVVRGSNTTPPPPGAGAFPTTCVGACVAKYGADVRNAISKYQNDLKKCRTNAIRLAAVGCVAGAVCIWVPGAGPFACCLANGAIVGVGSYTLCAIDAGNDLAHNLTVAENDYIACMAGCGITIAFE